jgi:hypothetical protein
VEEESLNKKSPARSPQPSRYFGGSLVTSRRAALAYLQNRLNELGENFAIEIREW